MSQIFFRKKVVEAGSKCACRGLGDAEVETVMRWSGPQIRFNPLGRAVLGALLLGLLAGVSACAHGPERRGSGAKTAPGEGAAVDEFTEIIHGIPIRDPFRWLEDADSAAVEEWVDERDEQTRGLLSELPARSFLAQRFAELFYVDSMSPPIQRGGRYFYARTHADREKAVVYWREGEQGEERVLLDPNAWSDEGSVSLGRWVPSWDGKKVVYARRQNAADEATLFVLDVDSGEVSKTDIIPGGKYASPVWTPDSSSFYYEWLPSDRSVPVDLRPGKTELRVHRLGSDPYHDPTIFPATNDPRTFLSGDLSHDGRYLIAYVHHGWVETDVWIKDLQRDAHFKPVVVGQGATYWAQIHQGDLYVLSDEGAPKLRLFKAPIATPERPFWKELVPENPDATLQAAGVVGGRLALVYLHQAASQIEIRETSGEFVRRLSLPALGSVGHFVGEPDSDDAFFSFSSFTTPPQVYQTQISSGHTELWAQSSLPLNPKDYQVSQVFYPSKDGTEISMFLVHKKVLKPSGKVPTLLYGYGGFNVSLQPSFRASILPWLDAGGLYAVANLRGGGEYGRQWHEAGRGKNKQKVFDDFEFAARYLVEQGWTVPQRLAIQGGSNGGLLVGAAMTQTPELYGAVICSVPLLDMVRYHLFGSGRTWMHEYGDPSKAEDLKVLHAYSPYHHLKSNQKYPPLLMLSAENDDRVDPMHARKFVAALEALGAPKQKVLLRVERNAGHGGADLVRHSIELAADQFAFLFDAFGVEPAARAESGAGAGSGSGSDSGTSSGPGTGIGADSRSRP